MFKYVPCKSNNIYKIDLAEKYLITLKNILEVEHGVFFSVEANPF